MNKDNNKRRAKRIDFSSEAKIRLLGEDQEISVNIKDITISGVKVVIGGRTLKVNTPLEIKMRISERDIQCKGRVAWVLAMRPGTGDINVFDVGIEFTEVNPEDSMFLKQLVSRQLKDGSDI